MKIGGSQNKKEDVVAEVLRLDQIENHVGIFLYLKNTKYENSDLLYCLYKFVTSGRFQSAYILAKLLVGARLNNPAVDLARGIGGALFDNAGDEADGASRLVKSLARLTPDQLATFQESIATPAFRHATTLEAVERNRALEGRLIRLEQIALPSSKGRGRKSSSSGESELWAPLISEMDRWSAAGRVATFWWRDDDAYQPTPHLERLLTVAGSHPVSLAVLPGSLKPELASWLAPLEQVTVLQHGWQHSNHNRGGGREAAPDSEYPDDRPPDEVWRELTIGREILRRHFGTRALPVFVPPWGGFSDRFLSLLVDCGFQWISDGGPRHFGAPDGSLHDINIQIDMDWRDPQRTIALLCDHLRARRTGAISGWEPTGILTHHMMQSAESCHLIAKLLRLTDVHNGARWLHGSEVFSRSIAYIADGTSGKMIKTSGDAGRSADVITEVLRLDRKNDHVGIFTYLKSTKYEISDVLYCLYQLITNGRFQASYILAKLLTSAGLDNPAVDLARGVGGAVFGNAADHQDGANRLAVSIARLNAVQLNSFRDSIAIPVFNHAMAREIAGRNSDLEAQIVTLRRIVDAVSGGLGRPVEVAQPGIETPPSRGESQATVIATDNETDRLDAARLNKAFADLQWTIPYGSRSKYAQLLIDATNAELPAKWRRPQSPAVEPLASALKMDGLARLGGLLRPKEAKSVVDYFAARNCYGGQVAAQSDGIVRSLAECQAAKLSHGSYLLPDVLGAPFLIEIANRQEILDLVEAYLGCTPTLYSMNAFWTFPNPRREQKGVQTFHRDHDDYRFCTIFLFLTETKTEDGAHYFIRSTHRPEIVEGVVKKFEASRSAPSGRVGRKKPAVPKIDIESLFSLRSVDLNETCALLFPDLIETVTAKAGSAVIEDTYGLHKGDVPKSPRLVVWMRYGLYKCKTNYTDRVMPVPAGAMAGRIPDTPYHRFVNRLLVQ